VIDLQHVIGTRSNADANPVSVLRSERERPQDEHVQRPLQQFQAILVSTTHRHLDVGGNLPPW
jgi:hypothetical protein